MSKPDKDPRLVAIGERIRKLRNQQNFSQESFALKMELGRTYYGGVERGERNIASLNLIRVATALGVEVGELFPSLSELKKLKSR